jgi:hypothetical protein
MVTKRQERSEEPVKKWLAALMLTLVFSTTGIAATQEEFARYVLMARTGQMKSEIRSNTDEIRAEFFYLGDEPVETSVVVLEVRFFTSNIFSPRLLSMKAQKWIDESNWKELSYEIGLQLDQEKPFVQIFYHSSMSRGDVAGWGIPSWRDVEANTDVIVSPYGQTDFQTYQDGKKAIFWESIAGVRRMWFVDAAPFTERKLERKLDSTYW